SVAFSPDGSLLASGSSDTTVRLWNIATRQPLGEPLSVSGVPHIEDFENRGIRLSSMAFLPDRGIATPVNGIAFSPDGRVLAAPNWDRTVRLWDVSTRTLLAGALSGHSDQVTSVRFSPDGKLLATSSNDRTVRLWDVANRTQLHEPIEHDGSVRDVAFSPDGQILTSASSDKTVRLWD